MIDYRIISAQQIRAQYADYVSGRLKKQMDGMVNEFEPEAKDIQMLEAKIGFQIQSFIVVFIPYLSPEKIENYERSNISLHAVSIDYHVISHKILKELANKLILKDDEQKKVYIQCDNGLFNERFFALQTGLCMQGKNGLAIHSIYGSYGFLGLIATDRILTKKLTQKKNCRQCNLCESHCPAKAITSEEINANKCLSYLTQKKNLTSQEENMIKKSEKIYGCDICQIVCPENQNIKYTEIEDFKTDLLYNIELEELYCYGNKGFKKEYGNRNFAWRGKSVLIRNLRLKENEQTDKDYKQSDRDVSSGRMRVDTPKSV